MRSWKLTLSACGLVQSRSARRAFTHASLAAIVALLVSCQPNALLMDIRDEVNAAQSGGQSVATPTFSYSPGSYSSDIEVGISVSTSGATIFYTVDGTTPSILTTPYSGPIAVAGQGTTVTIKAIAVKGGLMDSAVAEGKFEINYWKVSTPSIFPPEGDFTRPTPVYVIEQTGGAAIYYAYSTDGTPPNPPNPPPASPWILYDEQADPLHAPIVVGGDQTHWTILVRATKSGMADSDDKYPTFHVNLAVPAYSIGSATTSSVTVSWGTVTGATGYNVFRDVNDAFQAPAEIATNLPEEAASFQDSGLASGTTYYYKVQANYAGGPNLLQRSPVVSGLTLPAVPTGLTAGSPTSRTITLSWSASFGTTEYKVFRDTQPGGQFTQVVYSGSNTSYTDTGRALHTTYYYKVQAANSAGTSGPSSAVSATTLGEIYAATSRGLSISRNDGATWTTYKFGQPPFPGVTTHGTFASGSTIYAATSGFGLWISMDAGATWTTNYTTTNGLGSDTVKGVWASGSTIYAATSGGLTISTTAGASWTNRTTTDGLGNNVVNGIYGWGDPLFGTFLCAATSDGLSTSPGSGTSWTNYKIADGLGDNVVHGVCGTGSFGNTTTYYAATDGGLTVSKANFVGPRTWTTYKTANGLASDVVNGVYVTSVIYAATSNGLSISTNGGSSWTTYLAGNVVYGVYASGTTIYTATSAGLSISTNGGSSWTTYTTSNGLGSNTVYGVYAQ